MPEDLSSDQLMGSLWGMSMLLFWFFWYLFHSFLLQKDTNQSHFYPITFHTFSNINQSLLLAFSLSIQGFLLHILFFCWKFPYEFHLKSSTDSDRKLHNVFFSRAISSFHFPCKCADIWRLIYNSGECSHFLWSWFSHLLSRDFFF